MQPLPNEVCGDIKEYKRTAASEAKIDRLEKWPYSLTFGEVFETMPTSCNSFTVSFCDLSRTLLHMVTIVPRLVTVMHVW